MNRIFIFSLLFCTLFTSCFEDKCTSTQTFTKYTPVLFTVDEFRKDVTTSIDVKLENPGKIYFYKQYLFINEMGKGVHIYDLSDYKNPRPVVFYNIIGNFDIAIKDDLLIADNVIDLITLDISNILSPKMLKRLENYHNVYHTEGFRHKAYDLKSNETVILNCGDQNFGNQWFIDRGVFFSADNTSIGNVKQEGGSGLFSSGGVAGSLAKFTLYDSYLYTVSNSSLYTWKIDGSALNRTGKTDMGWGIETIFPYKDKLFIGSNNGMFIFNNSVPSNPYLLSSFRHARACDPVVVEGDVAYVTLRDGTACEGFNNQLDVIDIKDLKNPTSINSYPMKNPHGLSIRDGIIYLGEGNFGTKILDASDPKNVKEIDFLSEYKGYDMISLTKDKLFCIGPDGFYLFDTSNPKKMVLQSKILASK